MPPRVQRHESELGWWEMVHAAPEQPLRSHVRRYCGYAEETRAPLSRTEVPSAEVALILSLGPSIEVVEHGRRRLTSFIASLHDERAQTRHDGSQLGIEIGLGPLEAGMLLGTPMGELAGGVVELDGVLGAEAEELVTRLQEATTWEERFVVLDVAFARRLADAAPPPPDVAWAWSRLVATDGRLSVGELAAELGCSRRHLARRFREYVGVSPKTLARILRFQRVRSLLERDDGTRLAEIAQDCGYYDQAHLNRDFRDLAGTSPTELLSRRLPDGGGHAGEQVAFVQEPLAAAA